MPPPWQAQGDDKGCSQIGTAGLRPGRLQRDSSDGVATDDHNFQIILFALSFEPDKHLEKLPSAMQVLWRMHVRPARTDVSDRLRRDSANMSSHCLHHQMHLVCREHQTVRRPMLLHDALKGLLGARSPSAPVAQQGHLHLRVFVVGSISPSDYLLASHFTSSHQSELLTVLCMMVGK
eukprot:78662-Hanusia_phi.AAC.2